MVCLMQDQGYVASREIAQNGFESLSDVQMSNQLGQMLVFSLPKAGKQAHWKQGIHLKSRVQENEKSRKT